MRINIKTPAVKPQKVVEKPTLEEVLEKFSNNEIVGFQTEREKFRLFKAQGGTLCFYRKGSSCRGYMLLDSHLEGFRKWIVEKEVSPDDAAWKIIAKYRSYAEKATFENRFIKDCLSLPKTIQEWELNGKKSLYDYGVTTGVAKEGDVITIDGLKRVFNVESIRQAIKNKTKYSSGRYDFRGYEASVSIEIKEDGTMWGYLSLEFKGCGNGHYYLLINDETFIYYDKD